MPEIEIVATESTVEREELIHPFGFKGGYLTELWQNIVSIKSRNGFEGIGIATQSVLYSDANLFSSISESNGNTLMHLVTNQALKRISGHKFENPTQILDQIIPSLFEDAKEITGTDDLNINFLYNALVSVDNALWLLYASENGISTFQNMIPEPYKHSLSFRNDKIAVMYQISYDTSLNDIKKAAEEGYFVFKIKTGFPGNEEEMLHKDMERLLEIHEVLKSAKTSQTQSGKVFYTMDANGRYPNKQLLRRYLNHAKAIGAFSHILFYEEPFTEENIEDVFDLGLLIAADESVHTESDAYKKLELGYGAFVLKSIAKTLSLTLKIAKIADERSIPCLCSDLTVNPILLDWNKNIAAALKPFPGLGMGMIETNGGMNYKNWEIMFSRHPFYGKRWTEVLNGTFELDDHFYESAGGIFSIPKHYKRLFETR